MQTFKSLDAMCIYIICKKKFFETLSNNEGISWWWGNYIYHIPNARNFSP